ncbi:hypothetical protein STXM2123_5380 [Streptomyces sp. F-3]|nr:hypothetical protein STXM2123_5380 [Streptomyces sp. F-3]
MVATVGSAEFTFTHPGPTRHRGFRQGRWRPVVRRETVRSGRTRRVRQDPARG